MTSRCSSARPALKASTGAPTGAAVGGRPRATDNRTSPTTRRRAAAGPTAERPRCRVVGGAARWGRDCRRVLTLRTRSEPVTDVQPRLTPPVWRADEAPAATTLGRRHPGRPDLSAGGTNHRQGGRNAHHEPHRG